MERSHKRTVLVNLLVFLGAGVAALVISRYSQSLAGGAVAAFAGFGFLISAVSWFQMRLEEQERLEKLEHDELVRTAASGTLFNKAADDEVMPARQARLQFERFFVPGFTIILCVLQGVAAWFLWRGLDRMGDTHVVSQPLPALGTFGFLFLVTFLFGKYAATAARLEKVRLLQPGAGYLLLSAYLFLAATVGVALIELGFLKADYWVARGITVILGVVALETLLNLILEIYRPRMKGREARPVYQSRLVGLVGTPEGLVTTAAQALDYQFGFKVSDTWFYQFLERWLGRIILFQVVILLLSTCVVFIEPGEQGLIERFGRAVTNRQVLEAGPHLKWPWPIDKVYRYRTREVQSINIGFVPDPARENDPAIVWTIPHYKQEFNLLVASREAGPVSTNVPPGDRAVPVNLLTVNIPLQYEITDVRSWAYNHTDASNLLEQLASREVVRHLAGADFEELMSTKRGEAADELRRRIQSEAEKLQLGINVLFVGLQDIHPPTTVATDYEAVVGAQQELESKILKAQGEASKTTLLAQAESLTRVREAEAASLRRKSEAAAAAAQFTNHIAAYSASPEVYRQRLYLQTLARNGAAARKYVIGTTNAQGVFQLNLQESIRSDLINLSVGGK